MSKFKRGDKVRSLEESLDITTHDIYELIGVDGATVSFKDNVGVIRNRGFSSVELVVVQERPFKIDKSAPIFIDGSKFDNLLNPSYYVNRKIEVFDFISDTLRNNSSFTPEDGYQYGSITKYTARAGMKIIGNATLQEAKLQDLKKARRHLDEWIKSLELK